MTSHDLQLEERFSQLEAAYRSQRRLLIGILAIFLCGWLMSDPDSPQLISHATAEVDSDSTVFEAQELRIVNDEGEVVLSLQATENGGQVNLFDEAGNRCLVQRTNEHGGRSEIYNRDGKLTSLRATDMDGGRSSLYNNAGHLAVFNYVSGEADHGGHVEVYDGTGEQGKQRVWRAYAAEKGGRMSLYDQDSRLMVYHSVDADGGLSQLNNSDAEKAIMMFVGGSDSSGVIQVRNGEEDGKTLWEVSGNELGGYSSLFTQDGTRVARMGMDSYGGKVELFNTDKEPQVVLDSNEHGGQIETRNDAGRVTALLQSRGTGSRGELLLFNGTDSLRRTPVWMIGSDDQGSGRALQSNNQGARTLEFTSANAGRGGFIGVYDGHGDPSGGSNAKWKVASLKDQVVCQMFGENEQLIYQLLETNAGCKLSLNDRRENLSLELSSDKNGGLLETYDDQRQLRASVGMNAIGAGLVLANPAGTVVGSVVSNRQQDGEIRLHRKGGSLTWVATHLDSGEGVTATYDKNDEIIWSSLRN